MRFHSRNLSASLKLANFPSLFSRLTDGWIDRLTDGRGRNRCIPSFAPPSDAAAAAADPACIPTERGREREEGGRRERDR